MSQFAASLRSSKNGTGKAPNRKRARPRQLSDQHAAAGSTELRALLAKHNKKLRRSQASTAYTPLKHSIRTMRRWERQSGQKYYSLSALDREQAHAEMDAMDGAPIQEKVDKPAATRKQRHVSKGVPAKAPAQSSAKQSSEFRGTEQASSSSFDFDNITKLLFARRVSLSMLFLSRP